jgi:membrane-associated protein
MESVLTVIEAWGYLAIALGILMGNLGLPLPEEVLLPLGGYFAWTGRLSILGVLLVGVTSGALGDNLGYWLGRRGGRPLLERYGYWLLISPSTLRRADRLLIQYGQGAVFLGRFIAGLRFLAGPVAGVSRMPYRRFLLANLGGGIVWVTLAVVAGYLFGPHLHRLLTIAVLAGSAIRWVLLLGVAGFATFRVVRWYRSS